MLENGLWFFVVAGGPIILAAALAYALLRRRHRTLAERKESDRKTDELYRDPAERLKGRRHARHVGHAPAQSAIPIP
jgi:hypothetical protein